MEEEKETSREEETTATEREIQVKYPSCFTFA